MRLLFGSCFFKLIFIFLTLMGGNAQSNEFWRENITTSKYMMGHACEYSGTLYRDGSYSARAKEKYTIELQSKYKMFANYNNYFSGSSSHRLTISTPLHEISSLGVIFHSRADVSINLNGSDFDKLIQADSFFVYYPSIVFDEQWMNRLNKKHHAKIVLEQGEDRGREFIFSRLLEPRFSRLIFSSHLSTGGLIDVRERCHENIEAQKIAFEQERMILERENSKPINRLRNYFNNL